MKRKKSEKKISLDKKDLKKLGGKQAPPKKLKFQKNIGVVGGGNHGPNDVYAECTMRPPSIEIHVPD